MLKPSPETVVLTIRNKMRPAPKTPATLRKRANRSLAFSLVEVLVSVAVLGTTVVTFYVGISSGFSVVQLFRENLRATQVLAEKMETIRLYTYDQISSNGFIPSSFVAPMIVGSTNATSITFTGAVQVLAFNLPNMPSYSNDLVVLKVDVNWVSGGIYRTRSMQTLVAKNGLQTYIY
jgi:type II secretory pathway pseudopilin PulG